MNDLAARLQERLLAERRDGFRRLAGLRLTGTLPITSPILTKLLRDGLPADGPIQDIGVAILPNNSAVAVLSVDRWPIPKRVELALMVTSPTADARRPKLTGQIEVSGALGLFLPLLSGAFSRPGVTFQGRNIEVDLRELLRASGNADLLPLLKRLDLRTEKGLLLIDFELGTDA